MQFHRFLLYYYYFFQMQSHDFRSAFNGGLLCTKNGHMMLVGTLKERSDDFAGAFYLQKKSDDFYSVLHVGHIFFHTGWFVVGDLISKCPFAVRLNSPLKFWFTNINRFCLDRIPVISPYSLMFFHCNSLEHSYVVCDSNSLGGNQIQRSLVQVFWFLVYTHGSNSMYGLSCAAFHFVCNSCKVCMTEKRTWIWNIQNLECISVIRGNVYPVAL